MQVPERYKAALAELDRLAMSGELTVASYMAQAELAMAAIKDHPHRGDMVEGIAFFDPTPIDDSDILEA